MIIFKKNVRQKGKIGISGVGDEHKEEELTNSSVEWD